MCSIEAKKKCYLMTWSFCLTLWTCDCGSEKYKEECKFEGDNKTYSSCELKHD